MKDKATEKNPDYNPFAAVPVIPADVESRLDEKQHVQLRKRIPEKPGISGEIVKKLGFRRDLRVDLDARGSSFWQLIDGRRSLDKIEQRLRREWRLKRRESRHAVLEFTKSLMLRQLIQLDVAAAANAISGREESEEKQ